MLKKIQLTLKRSVGSFFYFYDVQVTSLISKQSFFPIV